MPTAGRRFAVSFAVKGKNPLHAKAGLLSLRASSCLVGIIAVSRASWRPYYRSYPFFEIKVQSHSRGGGNPVLCSKMDPRSGSGMTSMRGIVLLRDEDKTLPMGSKSLSNNLNLTALPREGEVTPKGAGGVENASLRQDGSRLCLRNQRGLPRPATTRGGSPIRTFRRSVRAYQATTSPGIMAAASTGRSMLRSRLRGLYLALRAVFSNTPWAPFPERSAKTRRRRAPGSSPTALRRARRRCAYRRSTSLPARSSRTENRRGPSRGRRRRTRAPSRA